VPQKISYLPYQTVVVFGASWHINASDPDQRACVVYFHFPLRQSRDKIFSDLHSGAWPTAWPDGWILCHVLPATAPCITKWLLARLVLAKKKKVARLVMVFTVLYILTH